MVKQNVIYKNMKSLTKIFEFDAAHRVMHERVKCFNLHGHRFKVEVTFNYDEVGSLGYAIDFKEVKRVVGGFIDTMLDHSCILNPMDGDLIKLCVDNCWKLWVMGMGNTGDINPSAENIANELFSIFRYFFAYLKQDVNVASIRFYETPTCWVDVNESSYTPTSAFLASFYKFLDNTGVVEYDDRKIK